MPTIAATTYKLIKASTPFIDGTALWHIIVVSVAAGCGLALAFGLILLGTEWGQESRDSGRRAGGWLMSVLAGAFCIAAIALGIYVMTHPAKSKPNKVVAVSQSAKS